MKKIVSLEQRMYDASTISDFLKCPYYGYLRHIKRIVPRHEIAALSFGASFHSMLEEWYTSHDIEKAVALARQVSPDLGDDGRTPERAELIMKEYAEHYKTEPFVVRQIESRFAIDMNIEDRWFVGRVDNIIDWNHSTYILDHKTTKVLSSSYFKQFRPSIQMTGYAYACKETTGQCDGIVINAISLAKKPTDRFLRDVSSRTAFEMAKWFEQFHKWADWIEHMIATANFPCNYGSCNMYFSDCMYKQLCVFGEDETMWNEFKVVEEGEQ